MALIAVNAASSRLGGGLVFAQMTLPRLAELLAQEGHVLQVFDHTAVESSRSWARTAKSQRLLHACCASADLILNMGNVAVFSAARAVPQWLVITNRLLVEPDPPPGTADGISLRARRYLLLASMLKSERWIVPSHAMGSVVLARSERWRVRPRPLEMLPHGAREMSPLPRPVVNAGAPYRAFYPASAYMHKNFSTIIEAIQSVRAAGRDVRLTLTIERHQLPDLMLGLPLPPDVDSWLDCVGIVTHSVVDHLYASHDVMVFPSLCESFGIPLREAAAQGLPVIATDMDVTREVAAEGTRFVPGLSVGDWVEALMAFTVIPSSGAAQKPRPHCTWEQVSRHLARSLSARVAAS